MAEALLSEILSDHVVHSAALQGLQIYVLGTELELHTNAALVGSSPSEVVLAIEEQ